MKNLPRCLFALTFFATAYVGLIFADPPVAETQAKAGPNFSEYRTVETAITTTAGRSASSTGPALPVHLGVLLESDVEHRLVVADVEMESAAGKAGLMPGDILLKLDEKELQNEDSLQDMLRTRSPGDAIRLSVHRQNKAMDLTATLQPVSRPRVVGRQRATLGVQVVPAKGGEGVAIDQVTPGSVAERAKLKAGEVILKLDQVSLTSPTRLRDILDGKQPDDAVTLTLLLAEKPVDLKIKLGAEPVSDGRPAGWEGRRGGGGPGGGYWTRPTYRLAIICVEYPDQKHNPDITTKAWEESMFSHGTYTKTNATGQPVYGSLYDYYLEQSFGHLKVEGKRPPA